MYIKKFSLFYVTKNRLSCGIWSESEKIESASLKKLSASLPEIIEAGLASSTNNKYYTGWKRWLDWCKENPEVNNLPGNPFFVALFFNHILLKYKTKGAIVSAFYGIRWGHSIAGFVSPTDHPFVKLAFEGCQRLADTSRKQPKEPISPEVLK